MEFIPLKKRSLLSGIYDNKFLILSSTRISLFSKERTLLLRINTGEKYTKSFTVGDILVIPGIESILIHLRTLEYRKERCYYYQRGSRNFVIRSEFICGESVYTLLNTDFEEKLKFKKIVSNSTVLDNGTIIISGFHQREVISPSLNSEVFHYRIYGFDNTLVFSDSSGYHTSDGIEGTDKRIYTPIVDGIFTMIDDTGKKSFLDLKYSYPIPEYFEKILCPFSFDTATLAVIGPSNQEFIVFRSFYFGIYIFSRNFSSFRKLEGTFESFSIDSDGVLYFTEKGIDYLFKRETFYSIVWRGIKVFSNFGFCNYLRLVASTF